MAWSLTFIGVNEDIDLEAEIKERCKTFVTSLREDFDGQPATVGWFDSETSENW